jgi:hypothetical protein
MKNRIAQIADPIEEYLVHEAEVRDRGETKIEGQISGRREWDGACIGSVEFCTNGPQGGDAGYGGFLRVTFRNMASTFIEVGVDDETSKPADAVAITFRGDAEISAFIESIKFLAAKLQAVESVLSLFQTRILTPRTR